MKDKIVYKLHEIEKKEQIKILYAVESGSRAWGFDSKDSDYDIRFVYVHPINWYVSVEIKRDTIEYPIESELDFSGWDIVKALRLFKKSNPPFYEWLSSPIVYIETGSFAQRLQELMSKFYSPKSSIYHYLHMASGNYRQYLQDYMVKIKKYFYVLRPIFACMWIEKFGNWPPMEFIKMQQLLNLDRNLNKEVENLYERKRKGDELGMENKIPIINNFLEEKIGYFEEYVKSVKSLDRSEGGSVILEKILQENMYN